MPEACAKCQKLAHDGQFVKAEIQGLGNIAFDDFFERACQQGKRISFLHGKGQQSAGQIRREISSGPEVPGRHVSRKELLKAQRRMVFPMGKLQKLPESKIVESVQADPARQIMPGRLHGERHGTGENNPHPQEVVDLLERGHGTRQKMDLINQENLVFVAIREILHDPK